MKIVDLLTTIKNLFDDIVTRKFSGTLTITINFHHGGITRAKSSYEEDLIKNEKN